MLYLLVGYLLEMIYVVDIESKHPYDILMILYYILFKNNKSNQIEFFSK